jgi:hypothetical protein
MPVGKVRIAVFAALVLVGLSLLVFGGFFHTADVSPQDDSGPIAVKSEPNLVKEVSVGGLERDSSGKIKQTYTGKPPEACST